MSNPCNPARRFVLTRTLGSLMRHAKAGGAAAEPLVAHLESQGLKS